VFVFSYVLCCCLLSVCLCCLLSVLLFLLWNTQSQSNMARFTAFFETFLNNNNSAISRFSHKITKSTMSAATMRGLDQFVKTIGTFQSMKDDLDEDYYSDLEEIVNNAMKQVSDRTGKYLHNLSELGDKRPDEDTLLKIIDNVPSCLSYEDEDGWLPIYTASQSKESLQYVPLLAKEGVKHNVGGDDARGGLIGDHHYVLELLTYEGGNSESYDPLYLDVMKKLRESKLLLKEDIQNEDLLYYACYAEIPMRFEYFADWCPEGLKTHQYKGLPLIHAIIDELEIEWFSTFLKTALKHHPNDLGLLFQKDNKGQTACERAFKKYRNDKTLSAIGELIPFDDPKVPILHHVAKHAPHMLNDFGSRYLTAAYFRDCQGRTLLQAKLASGNKTFIDDAMFFLEMSDEQVREIDPGSDLYPFMVAASGETCDLSAVYVLLRRNPSLAHRDKPKRRSKRKKMNESALIRKNIAMCPHMYT
jgi:hypothetical protein